MPTNKQLEEADRLAKMVDWSKVGTKTDAEITAAAEADTDTALPTDAELAQFDLVIPARSRRTPPQAAE